MNKNKFNLKCQELKKYEEEFLYNIRNRFAEESNQLSGMGLIMDFDLMFWNVRTPEEDMSWDRIEFSEGYMCFIAMQIRKDTDPYRDMDLQALCYQEPLTRIRRSFFTGLLKCEHCPEKYLNEFIQSVGKYINRVLDEGYEIVLKEAIEEQRNSKGSVSI